MTYLADTSAAWRLLRKQIPDPWPRYVAQGVVALCAPVEAELMVSVRADRDFEPFHAMLRRTFGWCPMFDSIAKVRPGIAMIRVDQPGPAQR